MKRLAIVAALVATPAFAQDNAAATVGVIGSVTPVCGLTPLEGDGAVFDLGVLIDTATGFLRDDLSAPPKTLSAAFCNARSTITVEAEPMTAQGFTTTPPAGFSRAVDFSAAASGWTETPAVFVTGAASNPDAVQSQDAAHAGDIVVSLSGFATQGGATLRPVADADYRGQVVVTLAVAD